MEVHKGLADVVVSETSLSAIVEGHRYKQKFRRL